MGETLEKLSWNFADDEDQTDSDSVQFGNKVMTE